MKKKIEYYISPEPIIKAIVRKTTCPKCGADYGRPCYQPGGKHRVLPHIQRIVNQLKAEKEYGYIR